MPALVEGLVPPVPARHGWGVGERRGRERVLPEDLHLEDHCCEGVREEFGEAGVSGDGDGGGGWWVCQARPSWDYGRTSVCDLTPGLCGGHAGAGGGEGHGSEGRGGQRGQEGG